MSAKEQENPTLLVIGYSQATQVAHQIRYFRKAGARVITLDHSLNDGRLPPLSWHDHGELIWQDENIGIDQINGVLVCNRAAEVPMEYHFQKHSDARLSWDEWFWYFCQQRDRSDTLLGLLLTYEYAGVSMVNPSRHSLISCRKPHQLHVMREVGCPLPKTLVSNDPERAREFILAQEETIAKPASGGALTLPARELLEENRLAGLQEAPAILQQRIYGDDVRVIVVDDKIVSSVVIAVPKDTIDFRGNHSYQHGLIQYRPIELPETIKDYCIRAAKALGLRFTGIDIKRTEDGQYFFLECNSSPMYLDVESKTGHDITGALYEALVKPL